MQDYLCINVFCSRNRDGDEWLHYRRILNKLMLMPNSTELMYTPCQEVAEHITEKWRTQSRDGVTIQNLEYQLYQWSIEGAFSSYI